MGTVALKEPEVYERGESWQAKVESDTNAYSLSSRTDPRDGRTHYMALEWVKGSTGAQHIRDSRTPTDALRNFTSPEAVEAKHELLNQLIDHSLARR